MGDWVGYVVTIKDGMDDIYKGWDGVGGEDNGWGIG